ncbi:MAG TPA: hypothetical protein PLL20_05525, partial [Phycisphaerae bacterium]|nr:hypothetical protein [Phycisphaerae bacterium]HRR86770.1 hypothetical protein [Phycisphaerae bacterium]
TTYSNRRNLCTFRTTLANTLTTPEMPSQCAGESGHRFADQSQRVAGYGDKKKEVPPRTRTI